MRLLILGLPILLTACQPATEYVYVSPDIPAELLTICPLSERQARTVKELAILATEHRRTAECSNGKIEAMAAIVIGEPQ